jgi:anti-sigma regulatory factor (Ser/Thr protein kinase)
MTSTTTDHPGFLHELVLHRSMAQMLEFVVPFVEEGAVAGEPTLLLVRPETATAVLDHVGRSPHLTLLPTLGQPGRAASDLRTTDALLAEHSANGARVRLLNQEPSVPGARWHDWRRLEAGVNVAFRRYDAWAVCAYDRRLLSAEMVDDLHATHPRLWQGRAHRRNDRYQDPFDFLGTHIDTPPDPIEESSPSAELLDPTPATARAAVAGFAIHSRLPAPEVEHAVFATHEAVSNAMLHGRPPVVLRLWARPGRLTTTVTDNGPGPTDPLLGLLPPEPSRGTGLGMWLSHQLVDVAHRRHPAGYTVRITAAHPDHGATGRPRTDR